jgi:hypothetical protein
MVAKGAGNVDHSKGVWAVWISIALSLATAAGAGSTWVITQQRARAAELSKLRADNEKIIANYLVATQAALEGSKQAYDHLQQFSYEGDGTLESYVYNARARGGTGPVAELEEIKELTRLSEDIRFRTASYMPCAMTPQYKKAGAAFLKYVGLYIRRAHAVEALAKTDEAIPVYDTFPSDFPSAVATEVEARKAADVRELSGSSCILDPVVSAPIASE